MNNCIIIIPIYKKEMLNEEKASLSQCCKILSKYDICFITPDNLDCSEYIDVVKQYDVNYSFKYFDITNFENIISYSRLMLKKEFYKEFLQYEYMLVYQLDAWVFEDRLENWCDKGFDYIGAPWFTDYNNADKNSLLIPKAGNGGFSLRNIRNMYLTIEAYENIFFNKRIKSIIEILNENTIMQNIIKFYKVLKLYFSAKNTYEYEFKNTNEDVVISNYFPIINKNFKVASAKDAISFSFEVLPERLFTLNNNNLPFGCHAFKKYNWDFWKQYIHCE